MCFFVFRNVEITLDCEGKTHPAFKMKKKIDQPRSANCKSFQTEDGFTLLWFSSKRILAFLRGLGRRIGK